MYFLWTHGHSGNFFLFDFVFVVLGHFVIGNPLYRVKHYLKKTCFGRDEGHHQVCNSLYVWDKRNRDYKSTVFAFLFVNVN